MEFLFGIYLVDILDILIISIFIYVAILFLKQTRSLLAFIGVSFLGIIYAIAQAFQLYITALVLQSFFSIFIIIIVIVFQNELKRSFELLAASGTRKIKRKPSLSFSSTIFAVIQATSNLMRKKHGALIVIPGQELIERHISGGYVLDGIVTSSLLESIFDPKSPGHDGAVIMGKERISKFGAHLPLSQNLKQIKEKGTRHSAAIGISEKTDVIVIVVSEERGEISIAKDGKLKTLKEAQELEKYLEQHYKEKFPEKPESFWGNLFKKRLPEKSIALAFACIVWFFLAFQAEIVQRDFSVPVVYTNIPENIIIEDTSPDTVTVTLSARGQATLAGISPESIRAIISGKEIETGTTEIELEKEHIVRPFNVSIIKIEPSFITITTQEYTEEKVPIKANVIKEPADLEIEEILIEPSEIKLLVPKNEEHLPEYIFTEEINLEEITETTTVKSKIILPPLYRLPTEASRNVTVTFTVEEND